MKKTILIALLAVILLAAPAHGAMTYSASDILKNAQNVTISNQYANPLYLWANEVEGILEGTGAADSFYLTPTDTEPGTSEGMFYADDSENILKYYNGSAWVSLGTGTFTGGNITSDCTLSNGVDLMSTTTTGQAATIKVYDNDTGPGYTNVLSWTNGNTPAIAMGAATSTWALTSSGLNVTTAGNVTGVANLTGAGTISLNDSATTNTTSIGGGTTTGAVSIGTGASAQTVNVATGAGAKTATFGSTNTTSTTNINSGSGGVNLNASNNQPTNIGTGTTTATVTIGGSAGQTIVVGTGAAAKAVSVGSTNSTSTTTVSSGSGGVNVNVSNNQPTNINTGTSTGAVTIGGGSNTVAIASTGLDIATSGAVTNATTIAGAASNTLSFGVNNRFEFTDNSETFGIDVGTTGNTAELCTDSGIDTLDFNDIDTLTDIDVITLESGLTISQPANNYFELTENSDTLQIIFGSNVWELGAGGTGVDTIDFNDVDTLTDIDIITLESGLTIAQPADNYFEFTENSDTFQMIFGSNVLELGSGGTGVVTIDFNDVDRLEDVEYISGDSGAKLDLSIDERVEFKDAAETFGFILNGSNKIELATDSGAVTLDFNDVDALEDIDTITLENGLVLHNTNDNRLEITENSDTLGLIFGSNKIELAACGDGVATIDFNDIDALEDIESLTGDGTGAIEGFFDTVVNDSDGMAQGTLTAADAGTVITNSGAGGAQSYVLPEASTCIGAKFTFVVMAANALRVDPYDATDRILLKTDTAGDYYWADAVGETLIVQAVAADNWVVLSEIGTWTEE